jgi:hypothetical protein
VNIEGLMDYLHQSGENPRLYEYAGSIDESIRQTENDLGVSSISLEEDNLDT